MNNTIIGRLQLLIYDDELAGGLKRLLDIKINCSDEGNICISIVPPPELVSAEQIESLNTASYHAISREVFDSWEKEKVTDREFYQILLEKLRNMEV